MASTIRTYKKRTLLGYHDNEPIFLSGPKWDCGWYWGFGYLGNNNCHYHVDGLTKISTYNTDKKVFEYEFVNLKDGFEKHFGDTFIVRPSDQWTFAELFKSFYSLRETAEILGRGGAHLSSNPCKDVIINTDETKRINEVVLPAIFDEIYKILERNADNQPIYDQIALLILDGDTRKVIDYMKANGMTPDDIHDKNGVSLADYYIIHSMWWKIYHAENKAEK